MNQAEQDFASLFPSDILKYPTREQDMFEHWDISVDGKKIDVKGRKKINRFDSNPQDQYHFLEIKNVRGNTGWCYGKSDSIAFQVSSGWIMVETEKLRKLISEKVEKVWVQRSGDCLYKLYRRRDRLDILTMVKTSDLIDISYDFIKI